MISSYLVLAKFYKDKAQEYKKAFEIACDLMSGSRLYGVDSDTIFEEVMKERGVFSSRDYEKYILKNLDRLSGKEV